MLPEGGNALSEGGDETMLAVGGDAAAGGDCDAGAVATSVDEAGPVAFRAASDVGAGSACFGATPIGNSGVGVTP